MFLLQHDKGFPRHDDNSTTERPPLPHHQQQVANYGPSSRPPPHPALYTSPYDDPYYYYGSIELGVPNGPSVGVPSRRGATFASAVGAGLAVDGPSGLYNLDAVKSKLVNVRCWYNVLLLIGETRLMRKTETDFIV